MLKLSIAPFKFQPKDGWHTIGAGQWAFVFGPMVFVVEMLHDRITVRRADLDALRFARWQRVPRRSPPRILQPRIEVVSKAISDLFTATLTARVNARLARLSEPTPENEAELQTIVDSVTQ